ncbi:MAG: dTDP-4-dehydrorhamnose reductase [Chitinispirillaceae bacterium]|nr:dTDP-4-dehydrorhamnose reductase [Chitinispirillaceae bacterium]
MRILVAGSNGMLGTDMTALARAAGHDVIGLDFPDIDITHSDSIRRHCDAIKPDAIINCAAYTAVDACETNEAIAYSVNTEGVGNLAQCAQEAGCTLVHISTDYVFDGTKRSPYIESDQTNPASIYGKSKLEGEKLVIKHCSRYFILRIAWLYGLHGNNFVRTIRTIAAKNSSGDKPLRVVSDQRGTPTYTVDVCRQTLRLLTTDHFGLYHATNEGSCSWYNFASAIVAAAGIPVRVEPCSTTEFPRPAPRPANSVLENAGLKKLGLNIMQEWSVAWQEFLKSEKTV